MRCAHPPGTSTTARAEEDAVPSDDEIIEHAIARFGSSSTCAQTLRGSVALGDRVTWLNDGRRGVRWRGPAH